jgi:hypothetical protein
MSRSLIIVLVSQECLDELYNSFTHRERVLARCGVVQMLFVQEHKSLSQLRGVSISSWVLGDPQVSRTRVTYEYVMQYKSTYGSGYGSRPMSYCLDSVNSYRDKRFNLRVHPSPLIHDSDISKHQYFLSQKQRSCLLQMKLQSILHSLTSDITFVAERINPYMVGITSGLSTKLIATMGQSLYSFCNGLHTDICDQISEKMKLVLFPNVNTEEKQKLLSFKHLSFPTTIGYRYQYVWKDSDNANKYEVNHHFVMPGIGLAVTLEDSIFHHFMGGAFSHSTSICVLEQKFDDDDDNIFSIRNEDNFFSVFAFGSTANTRTARGNSGQQNVLADHRMRQHIHRTPGSEGTQPPTLMPQDQIPAVSQAQLPQAGSSKLPHATAGPIPPCTAASDLLGEILQAIHVCRLLAHIAHRRSDRLAKQ